MTLLRRLWRTCGAWALLMCCASCALAQLPRSLSELPNVVTHDNEKSGGVLRDGVLTIHLSVKEGAWHPEDEKGPALPVLAFTENDGAPMAPGPMIRVPAGTKVHAVLTNPMVFPLVVHGLHSHPGDVKDSITVPPGQTVEKEFLAGAPGTYLYWATCFADIPLDARNATDTLMTGAFIVDGGGMPTDDRVMVLGLWYNWLVANDFNHGFHEVLTVNGKSFPYDKHLTYKVGDTVHWRVINGSVGAHPMHLHGAYFRVDAAGDVEKENLYTAEQQRMVVTELMDPGRTMLATWKPERAGNWLFHCHLAFHMQPELAQELREASGDYSHHDMNMMEHGGMAGLVVGITVLPAERIVNAAAKEAAAPHRQTLTVTQAAGAGVRVEVRDGDSRASSAALSGPPIILHRDEPSAITVRNELRQPTAIHWHGMELESYYDGVPGFAGDAKQMTPAIPPGGSFVARMTPPRAGTFIYHTHWHDAQQLADGLYGPLIVLEPGERYDAEHDHAFVVGRGGPYVLESSLLVNGSDKPGALELRAGESYRLRFVNITPSDDGDELNLREGDKPVRWRAVAKDGWRLPAQQATERDAHLVFAAGETYDFEFRPEKAAELSLVTEFGGHRVVIPVHVK